MSNLKKLQNRAEKLWKAFCYKRDGRECMVKKYFPNIAIEHTDVIQIDHCFTRKNKHLFVDVRNGTCVCSACNMAKAFSNKSVCRAIDEIVKNREGQEAWEEMLAIDQAKMSNNKWNSIPYVESLIKKLQDTYAEWFGDDPYEHMGG